jgi:HK97 family phage major capsid protein
LFIPSNRTVGEAVNFGTLLGRPVVFSEHAEQLGTVGDLSLIDPLGYYSANKKSGTTFAQSMHLYFDYDMQAFRWTVRFGGQPLLSAAITRAKSSNTKSHFVTLGART